MDKVLIYFALKYKGDTDKMFNALKSKEEIDPDFKGFAYNGAVVTIVDKNYPEYFKSISNPPMVLFYRGNLDLVDRCGVDPLVIYDGTRLYSTFNFKGEYFVGVENLDRLDECAEALEDTLYVKKGIN